MSTFRKMTPLGATARTVRDNWIILDTSGMSFRNTLVPAVSAEDRTGLLRSLCELLAQTDSSLIVDVAPGTRLEEYACISLLVRSTAADPHEASRALSELARRVAEDPPKAPEGLQIPVEDRRNFVVEGPHTLNFLVTVCGVLLRHRVNIAELDYTVWSKDLREASVCDLEFDAELAASVDLGALAAELKVLEKNCRVKIK